MPQLTPPIHRPVLSVSELTAKIKSLLEEAFSFVWVTGEISNFRQPASGHFYFSLKDANSQISAVMFRGQNRTLKFDPTDGMHINGLGRLSVYEPRGSYQIIMEYLEPVGAGALQTAFEQLKARLAAEGLFDSRYKKELPFLPKSICLVTSPTGAALQDMLKILRRRFDNIRVRIIPVSVQGDAAPDQVAAAIGLANRTAAGDLVIVARGGGSLEDLQAFNTETVARAIFASELPVVSAIGHEIDYTIADFVADFRAPTPSAAAEAVVPVKADLAGLNRKLLARLATAFLKCLRDRKVRLERLTGRLRDPRREIMQKRIRTDELSVRLRGSMQRLICQQRDRLDWRLRRLGGSGRLNGLLKNKQSLEQLNYKLLNSMRNIYTIKTTDLQRTTARLQGLNPSRILERGYSITRTLPRKEVVRSDREVSRGQHLEILLSRGRLQVQVEQTDPETR